ncbi:MAG: hypothetical protein JWR72_785 [Flavisolibacter sp.]|nr:hypothetical protein [Flavisolibacter sp.]
MKQVNKACRDKAKSGKRRKIFSIHFYPIQTIIEKAAWERDSFSMMLFKTLSHQVHFTISLIKILIGIVFGAFILIQRLAIKVCYHAV